MPTIKGWLITLVGVALIVTGRGLGAEGLEQLGFALIVLIAVAVGVVRLRTADLRIVRQANPEKATAGRPVTISLLVRNPGRASVPLVLLQDRLPVELATQARFAIPGLEAGGKREMSFRVTPPRRGRYDIGPLDLSFVDPFGVAQVRREAAGTTAFFAHPRVQRLVLPRDLAQQRSLALSALKQPSGGRGDDFYTLREWSHGDDLRKIHWPSTAKRQKVMIRQEEISWHTRVAVVLDDRRSAHDGFGNSSSFERAVEAAASVVSLYEGAGYSYRFATATQPGLAAAKGSTHLHRCLDLLTTADLHSSGPNDPDPLVARLAAVQASGTGEGALVVIAGTVSPETALALSGCQRTFRQIIVLSFPAHRFGRAGTRERWEGEKQTFEVARLLTRSGGKMLVLGPGDPLAAAWGSLGRPGYEGAQAWEAKPELV